MSNANSGPSKTMQEMLTSLFAGDKTPATKEDVARVWAAIVDIRDILTAQSEIMSLMPLTSAQAAHFNEDEMPIDALQEKIGDGTLGLLGINPEKKK